MRLSDYKSRLFKVIADYEDKPFAYGQRDCALFGADVYVAMTGIDPASEWRGKYKSLTGGLKLIKQAGYSSQVDWIERHCTEKASAFCQFGDLAIVSSDGGTGYSVCVVGGSFLIGMSEANGLIRLPLNSASKFYRIGEAE